MFAEGLIVFFPTRNDLAGEAEEEKEDEDEGEAVVAEEGGWFGGHNGVLKMTSKICAGSMGGNQLRLMSHQTGVN